MDGSKIDTSRVGIFSKVTIRDIATQRDIVYTLVGEEEANLKERKISITSPIGKALVGKKLNDRVSIKVPAGELQD